MAALNAASAVGMGASLKQGSDQMKQAEAQAQEQAAQNEKITKALNKIAKSASNNPQAAQQAAEVMGQKQFAAINPSFMRNAKGFAKDIGKLTLKRKDHLIGGVLAGGAMAGASYAADKAVQADMKKSGIPLPPKQKSYAAVGSVMGGLKTAGKTLGGAVKKNKGMIGMMAGMGALPVGLDYMADKKEMKDQMKATQRTYAATGWIKGLKSGFRTFKSHPGQSILGGISNLAGGGGTKGVQKFGKQLEAAGRKSGSEWSKKGGQFIQKNPKTALGGSILVGAGTISATWGQGEKGVNKLARKVDNNAFRYQDSKNHEVQ